MLNELDRFELLRRLDELQELSDSYYRTACKIGMHTFIEHTGFINEHLKILRKAAVAGVDVANLSNHSNDLLRVEPYEVDYLAEKFACMFAPLFKKKKVWAAFVAAAEAKGCGTVK